MILHTEQTTDTVDVSYINKDGGVSIKRLTPPDGFKNWVITDDYDPQASNQYRNWKGEKIKQVHGKKFYDLNLREFLTKRVSKEVMDDIHAFNVPEFYSVDIEVKVEDEFPLPEFAKYEVYSVSISAPNLSTIVFTTARERMESDTDNIVCEYLNDYFKDNEVFQEITGGEGIKYTTFLYDDEPTMLRELAKYIKVKLHCVGGWYFKGFDWPYLVNRSEKLGFDFNELCTPLDYEKGQSTAFNSDHPKHRLVMDYQELIEKYAYDISPKLSMKLDWMANKIVGIGKVPYDGSFREMLEGEFWKFLAYNAVDTILVSMIHHAHNTISAPLSIAFYAKIPINNTSSTTAIADAVTFDEMWNDNIIYSEKKARNDDKAKYKGGYVKDPLHKVAYYPVCVDFEGLYPAIKRATNMGPDSFVRKLDTKAEILRYKKDKNHFVAVTGSLYKNDKPYMLKRIQDKLYSERNEYKGYQKDLYNNAIKKIDDELKRRKK